MTSDSRIARRLLIGAAALMAAIGMASPSSAEEPGPAAIAQPDDDASQQAHFEYWRARADAARQKVSEAGIRLDAVNSAVSRMQRRNHPRGEARRALRTEQQEARVALEEAVRELEVELPAEVRAAGGQQAWIRERSRRSAR